MNIRSFSPDFSSKTKRFVLEVLSEEGFEYDALKDVDLDDIKGNYICKGGAFFIFLHNDELIGTSAVRNLGSDTCEIKRLYVKKEYRGKGLGLSLFRTAMDFAKRNHSCVKLKTDPSLKQAISIYLKHGFILIKEENGILYFEKDL